MKEVWKYVPGYCEKYMVSNLGNVKSFVRETPKLLSPIKSKRGYCSVCLCDNGKKNILRVHRIVLLAFVGPNDKDCNHKDFNRSNNALYNLEYCTRKENVNYSAKYRRMAHGSNNAASKLTNKQAIDVKHRLNNRESCRSISLDYPISKSGIEKIKQGLSHKYVEL